MCAALVPLWISDWSKTEESVRAPGWRNQVYASYANSSLAMRARSCSGETPETRLTARAKDRGERYPTSRDSSLIATTGVVIRILCTLASKVSSCASGQLISRFSCEGDFHRECEDENSWLGSQASKRAVQSLFSAVTGHLSIHHIRHITALGDELHTFGQFHPVA